MLQWVHGNITAPMLFDCPEGAEAVRGAILAGDLPSVEAAISAWFERDTTNRTEKDKLMFAVADSIEAGQLSILSYLLSQGIPYRLPHVKLAVTKKAEDALEIFLANGWNINEPESWSTPPLLGEAIRDEHLARWFLSKGANPNAECTLDMTPLSVAMISARFSTIELLFDHGGSAEHGQLLYFAAARTDPDRLQVLDFLLSKGAEGINRLLHQHRPFNFQTLTAFGLGTPLHRAAEEGLLDTVRFLLDHGADPSVEDTRGCLAIEHAERKGHSGVVKALEEALSGNLSEDMSEDYSEDPEDLSEDSY